jgi:hypothetical protein
MTPLGATEKYEINHITMSRLGLFSWTFWQIRIEPRRPVPLWIPIPRT